MSINDDLDRIEEEKRKIDLEQKLHAETIVEIDEAAQSAEGMDNLGEDIHKDVEEDRDATPPNAIDVPDSSIIS